MFRSGRTEMIVGYRVEQHAVELVQLTADIVQAYLTHNIVAGAQLPDLFSTVHAALSSLGEPPAEPEKLIPSIPIRKSVRPVYLISLEDGRRYQTLKRHGPPPDKWSSLRYGLKPCGGLFDVEEAQAGRDRHKAAAG